MSDQEKLIQIESEMLKTIVELEKAPDKVADAVSLYETLDESKKAVLADLFNKADPTLTDKKREMAALADPIYTTHLDALGDSNKERIRVKLKTDVLFAKLEVLRSLYSGEKARINIQ